MGASAKGEMHREKARRRRIKMCQGTGSTSREMPSSFINQALVDAVGLPGFPHGQDILGRDICLDVVYRCKDKAAARSQCFDIPPDVRFHFGSRKSIPAALI